MVVFATLFLTSLSIYTCERKTWTLSTKYMPRRECHSDQYKFRFYFKLTTRKNRMSQMNHRYNGLQTYEGKLPREAEILIERIQFDGRRLWYFLVWNQIRRIRNETNPAVHENSPMVFNLLLKRDLHDMCISSSHYFHGSESFVSRHIKSFQTTFTLWRKSFERNKTKCYHVGNGKDFYQSLKRAKRSFFTLQMLFRT